MSMIGAGVGSIMLIIYLGFLGLGIYCTVLFIKLALRGLKALDIYIEKNGHNRNE